MNRAHYVEGQVLFREGNSADSVFRLLSGVVDIFRELDGDPILLGTIGPRSSKRPSFMRSRARSSRGDGNVEGRWQ